MNNKISTRKIILVGLFSALVFVATYVIKIPGPSSGYYHAGDSLVIISGALLGPLYGGLSAALGSFLADIFAGYALYAPATFVIKGLEAALVGSIFFFLLPRGSVLFKIILGALLGGVIMVAGYFAFESVILTTKEAMGNISWNVMQGLVGGLLSIPLYYALQKLPKEE